MGMSAFRKMKLQRELAEKAKLEAEVKEVNEVGIDEVGIEEEPTTVAKTDAEKLKKKK